jgi:hypothetical protein
MKISFFNIFVQKSTRASDVPRGTFMSGPNLRALSLLFLFLFAVGCNKRDPTPEKGDGPMADLAAELEIARKSVDSTTKDLAGLRKEQAAAIPQTGQFKIFQNKINDAEASLDIYKQQVKYFEIKLELRRHYIRQRYDESLKGGRPWPDEQENKEYTLRIKLQREKLNWGKPRPKEPAGSAKPTAKAAAK